jgi:DNA-binding transcriptional LysR family regulator
MPMDWDKLRIFHAVAEAGSLTHAGDILNLSQSAVSRQISALEDKLGVPLFHRHARGLILTEQGELLNRTVKDVFHKLSMAESRLTESRDKPSGPLKVTTTIAFGSFWLTPAIAEFLKLFPEIDVSLILTDEELDLGMREADVAIRMTAPRQPDLVQRLLTNFTTRIYASEAYIAQHGEPKTQEDLDHHRIVIFGHSGPMPTNTVNWLLDAGARPEFPRRPVLRVNNMHGIYRAIRAGIGIGALPEFAIPSDVALREVLPQLEGPPTQAYFVYPEELRASKRVAVFRDFLLRKVAEARL